tara:strand:+ start:296 stop:439 length:144 start_codon:yes stop_codon:yes gene_type:complete
MSENLINDNPKNDGFNFNSEESDYKNLITRLKEIKLTIALLEKTTFK